MVTRPTSRILFQFVLGHQMSSPLLLFSVTQAQCSTGLLLVSSVIILASDLSVAEYLPQYICSSCDTPLTPIHCEWSSWSWSQCSATCGPGVEVGRRFVSRYSDRGGRPCGSKTRDTRTCNLGPCVTNCLWGQWTAWACSGDLKIKQISKCSIVFENLRNMWRRKRISDTWIPSDRIKWWTRL